MAKMAAQDGIYASIGTMCLVACARSLPHTHWARIGSALVAFLCDSVCSVYADTRGFKFIFPTPRANLFVRACIPIARPLYLDETEGSTRAAHAQAETMKAQAQAEAYRLQIAQMAAANRGMLFANLCNLLPFPTKMV